MHACRSTLEDPTRPLAEASFRPNSVLIFGSETEGLPARILEKHPDRCFAIPMTSGKVRSLNLSTAVGIVLYDALQKVGRTEAAEVAATLDDPPQPTESRPPRPRRGRPSRRPPSDG